MSTRLSLSIAVTSGLLALSSFTFADDFQVLKQLENKPMLLKKGEYQGNYYVPSTLKTITWGYLPNKNGFVAQT